MTMSVTEIRFQPSGNYEQALAHAACECGIDRQYWDIFHKMHEPSPEAQSRILQALGWDTSSQEAIERERRRRFELSVSNPVPSTLVVSESQKSVPVTLSENDTGSLYFEILLEDGYRLASSIETSQLGIEQRTFDADHQWLTYKLDLPAEVPLGYHVLKLDLNGRSAGQSNLILCPDRAYLPGHLDGHAR